MIKLYRFDISKMTDDEYDSALSRMPDEIRQKIVRKRYAPDRKRSLAGYMLALDAAKEFCGEPCEIAFAENGKPYFVNSPLRFSISHSGERVILALSDREIGADVEKIRPIPCGVAKRFFTEREQKADFFEVWTKKEAYGKCKGDMSAALAIDVLDFEFYTENDGEYALAVYEE